MEMEYLIEQLILDTKGIYSISKIPAERLETYIANELIDEEGNLIIELPKPIYYSKSVKDAITRYQQGNREKVNKSRREYHRNRCKNEPGYQEYHNLKCKLYNKRVTEKKKFDKIQAITNEIEKKRKEIEKLIQYKLDENGEKIDPKSTGFYVMKFD